MENYLKEMLTKMCDELKAYDNKKQTAKSFIVSIEEYLDEFKTEIIEQEEINDTYGFQRPEKSKLDNN
jgi:hypothetical protein